MNGTHQWNVNIFVKMSWSVVMQICTIHLIFQAQHSFQASLIKDVLDFGPDEICCGAIGCFNKSAPYDRAYAPFYRPLPLPDCPEDLNIEMKLHSREDPLEGQNIDRKILPRDYVGSKLTIIIVCGWMSAASKHTIWPVLMKDEFLRRGDYNVILVSWDGESDDYYYPKAASNVRSVAAELALVIDNLKQNGGSTKSLLYCIGHSIGAHVCGLAGHLTSIGRITGLDPAGPEFEHRDVTAGLNPANADLVDVIHTDGNRWFNLNLGLMRTVGHVDFYPNGGLMQRACQLQNVLCSHSLVINLFLESIRTPCFFVLQNCTDPRNLPSSCAPTAKSAIQSMGFEANKFSVRGIFYLETNEKPTYCRK